MPFLDRPTAGAAMNISLRQMRAFSAVARAGSFHSQGPAQVNLTQSAVSMLAQQLEEALGVTLFDRGAAVTLTEAGRQLLLLARRILDDVSQVVEGASDLRSLRTGLLRVVAPQMLSCTWISTGAGRVRNGAPGHRPARDRRDHRRREPPWCAAARPSSASAPSARWAKTSRAAFLMDVPIRMVCPATASAGRAARRSWTSARRALGDLSGASSTASSNASCSRTTPRCRCRRPSRSATSRPRSRWSAGTGPAAVPDYARMFADNFNVRCAALRASGGSDGSSTSTQRRGMALSPGGRRLRGDDAAACGAGLRGRLDCCWLWGRRRRVACSGGRRPGPSALAAAPRQRRSAQTASLNHARPRSALPLRCSPRAYSRPKTDHPPTWTRSLRISSPASATIAPPPSPTGGAGRAILCAPLRSAALRGSGLTLVRAKEFGRDPTKGRATARQLGGRAGTPGSPGSAPGPATPTTITHPTPREKTYRAFTSHQLASPA